MILLPIRNLLLIGFTGSLQDVFAVIILGQKDILLHILHVFTE